VEWEGGEWSVVERLIVDFWFLLDSSMLSVFLLFWPNPALLRCVQSSITNISYALTYIASF
jgi:hypothetical protein